MEHHLTQHIIVDANLINDNGLKLSYGSYFDGMFMLNLSDITTPTTSLPGARIAGSGQQPAEAGFMYKPASSDYFYFFFSYGKTPTDVVPGQANGTEYRVLVGRSKSITGPFLDKDGKDLTENVTDPPPGTVVLASHGDVYAPGGI